MPQSLWFDYTLAIAALFMLGGPAPLTAQDDAALLAGPCVEAEVDFRVHNALRDAVHSARRDGNLDAALSIQRDFVRLRCRDSWRWVRLAALLLEAERPEEAVTVIDYIEPWAANYIQLIEEQHRLSDAPLDPLWETDAFHGSELAARMEARRAAHRERRRAFQERLDSLAARPPDEYVARDACPFECCVYREWTVEERTELFDDVAGSSVVAVVESGDRVEGLTGQVHVTPSPVGVVHPPAWYALEPGDIFFLLDYVGEGFYHVWVDGEVRELELDTAVRGYCPIPAEDCWGERLADTSRAEASTWWVKVRTSGGLVGWTDRSDRFGNIDACG